MIRFAGVNKWFGPVHVLRDGEVDPLQHLEGAEGFVQFPNL